MSVQHDEPQSWAKREAKVRHWDSKHATAYGMAAIIGLACFGVALVCMAGYLVVTVPLLFGWR